MGVLTHIINSMLRSEKQQKKFLTNCVKTKGLKKNIYIFYSKHISLKTTTSKKISLSLSQNIISNCLKKFIHRYGVLHTTGSTKNSTSKKKQKLRISDLT